MKPKMVSSKAVRIFMIPTCLKLFNFPFKFFPVNYFANTVIPNKSIGFTLKKGTKHE